MTDTTWSLWAKVHIIANGDDVDDTDIANSNKNNEGNEKVENNNECEEDHSNEELTSVPYIMDEDHVVATLHF
eukprot:14784599-Ditylum_brightwellii.AAC.1